MNITAAVKPMNIDRRKKIVLLPVVSSAHPRRAGKPADMIPHQSLDGRTPDAVYFETVRSEKQAA
jgi:hypothetical protein